MVRIRPARVAPSDEVDAALDAAGSGAPAFDAAGGVAARGDAAGGGANDADGWSDEPKSGAAAAGDAGGPAGAVPLEAGAGAGVIADNGAGNGAALLGVPAAGDAVVASELSVGLANATRSVAIVGTIATATRPSAASVATSKVTFDPSDAPGTGLVQSYFGASLHAPSCAGLNDSAPGASAHA